MKKWLICALCILVVLGAVLFVVKAKKGSGPAAQTDSTPTDNPIQNGTQASDGTEPDACVLTDGLFISEVFSYSGAYVEDGSNDPCENVCAVRIENRSDVHYEYLRFTVTTSGGAYDFSVSTLFAGARMTVLCENKAAFTDSELLSSDLINAAPFTEPPTVHLDELKITYTDGFINVSNLTENTLSNIYIYYKNIDDYGYLGGITYRVNIEELPAGGMIQARAANIHLNGSRVVFATYGS